MNLVEYSCVYEDAGKTVETSYIGCLGIVIWLLLVMLFLDINLSFCIQR